MCRSPRARRIPADASRSPARPRSRYRPPIPARAEPGRRASLPRSIQRPTRRAVNTGMMAKPVAMMPSQTTGRPSSNRPVGGRIRMMRISVWISHHMGEERDEQAIVRCRSLGRRARSAPQSSKDRISRLDGLRPAAVTCLRLAGAGQRLLGLPRPANAHCWGGGSDAGGSTVSSRRWAPKRWKIVAVGTLNGGLCTPASPSVGPREANFFPYLSIQLPPVGDHLLGLGITRFRLAWKVRALTRLSPWGGLRRTPVPAGHLRPE